MKKIKPYFPYPGQWVSPVKTGYRNICCDCGLVHIRNYRVLKNRQIEIQSFRDDIATAEWRREMAKQKKKK